MVRGAHDGAITTVEWIPGQPVLVTSSEDNSVKVNFHIFFDKFFAHVTSNGSLILQQLHRGCSNSDLDTMPLLISFDIMAMTENNY